MTERAALPGPFSCLRPVSPVFMTVALLAVAVLLSACGVVCRTFEYGTKLVPDGQEVNLECPTKYTNDSLKAVKWFKDGKEFCSGDLGHECSDSFYMACAPRLYYPVVIKRPKLQFETRINPKIYCEGTKVNLGEVNLMYNGLYSCRVFTTESNLLKVVARSVSLLVYATRGPHITGFKPHYMEGEVIHANCTAAPSNPPPTLVWYINGLVADGWSSSTYPCQMTENGLCVLRTVLRLQATKKLFTRGLASFVCESTIMALPSRRAFVTASLVTSPSLGRRSTLHQGLLWIPLIFLLAQD